MSRVPAQIDQKRRITDARSALFEALYNSEERDISIWLQALVEMLNVVSTWNLEAEIKNNKPAVTEESEPTVEPTPKREGMVVDVDRYDELCRAGLVEQHTFYRRPQYGEAFGLVAALVPGAHGKGDCVANGWPRWLVEICTFLFDMFPEDEAIKRGRNLAVVIHQSAVANVDWNVVRRLVRVEAILPIALEVIGHGDEPWREQCRDLVQWALDKDGAHADYLDVGLAAREARRAADEVADENDPNYEIPDATIAAEAVDAAGDSEAAGATSACWISDRNKLDRVSSALITAMMRAR